MIQTYREFIDADTQEILRKANNPTKEETKEFDKIMERYRKRKKQNR